MTGPPEEASHQQGQADEAERGVAWHGVQSHKTESCKVKIKLQLDFALHYISLLSPSLIKSQWEEAAGRRKHQRDYTNCSCARRSGISQYHQVQEPESLPPPCKNSPPTERREDATQPAAFAASPESRSSQSLLPNTLLFSFDGIYCTRKIPQPKGRFSSGAFENPKAQADREKMSLTGSLWLITLMLAKTFW